MSKEIQTFYKILADTSMCFLATLDHDVPRVRAFQYQFEQSGKLWFCTSKSKDVFRQIQANPVVEICAVKHDMIWVRVDGKVTLEDNREIKKRILAEQPLIRGIYKTEDNPDFTTFCLEHGTYTIAGFSGNPPHQGSF